MSVIWKYLDKRSATIAAIKDFSAMEFIIAHTDEEIIAEQEKMIGVSSPRWDGMPHAYNPQAGEDRLVKVIDEIDVLRERYRQAVEYMEWFKPAWDALSEEEQFVLETFFSEENTYGSSAIYYIQEHLKIEQSTAYKRKNRALDHLTVLLFGKS